MSKGILVFAKNNSHVDYVKQAYFLANRAKEYLGLPTTIVTDSEDYLRETYADANKVFDEIISVEYTETENVRKFHDGALASKRLQWKNAGRSYSYDLSPYDETIVVDTDVVISNSNFLKCFDNHNDLLMYKERVVDVTGIDRGKEFEIISDTSVDFYWATVIFFRKTETNKIFFDLVRHIEDNWQHYRNIYQLPSSLYRNDYAFSIAIHVMNGYEPGNFVSPMPGTLYYITDKSILWQLDKNSMFFLLEKPDFAGEYTAVRLKDANVHVMNKFSLNRCIDEQ